MWTTATSSRPPPRSSACWPRRPDGRAAAPAGPLRHGVPIGPCPAGRFGPHGDCGVVHESVYCGRLAPPSQARVAGDGVIRTPQPGPPSGGRYMSRFVDEFMAELRAKNPAEVEFHQAAQEVAESLDVVFDKHPIYREKKILERIAEPERVIMFRVPWIDDKGEVQILSLIHISEPTRQAEISYAVFCLKKKKKQIIIKKKK